MKLKTKIISGYLLIILTAVVIGVFFLYQLLNISAVVSHDLPLIIKNLSAHSYLNNLAQSIRYYDEVLTQSVRNYAFTQDSVWKDRYYAVVDDLDANIKAVIANGDDKDGEYFHSIDQSNLRLVALEEESFALVDNGQPEAAVEILEGDSYQQYKKEYNDGLVSYFNRQGQEYDKAYSISTFGLDEFMVLANKIIKTAISIYVISMIFGILLALVISFFLSRLIVGSVINFKKIAEEIARGDLNKRVVVESKDEFSDLAVSFNKMADNLQKSLFNSKEKIQKRTQDLEKINKYMVGRELKMVELKKEIQTLKSKNNV